MNYDPQPGFGLLDGIMCAIVLALIFTLDSCIPRPKSRVQEQPQQPEIEVIVEEPQ